MASSNGSAPALVDDLRTVCFMHIGKVGGHSISRELLNRFALTDAYNGSPEQFDDLAVGDLDGKKLVIGHFAYCHTVKLPKHRFLFSMVRDPIDRVVSNYWYLRSYDGVVTETSAEMLRLAKSHDFDSFVRLPDLQVRQVVENHQCMFFAKDWRSPERLSEASLDLAIKHLDEYDFIGLHEKYDDSMQLLCGLLGWQPWPSEVRLNVTPRRDAVSEIKESTLEHLRKLNRLDLALYAKVAEMYEARRSQIINALVAYASEAAAPLRAERAAKPVALTTDSALHELVANRSKLASRLRTRDAPRFVRLTGDGGVNGRGWGERAIIAGHYARPLADEATIIQSLDRSRGAIARVSVVGWTDQGALDRLVLEADGVKCPRTAVHTSAGESSGNSSATISFALPPSEDSQIELRLRQAGETPNCASQTKALGAIGAIELDSLGVFSPSLPIRWAGALKQSVRAVRARMRN